MREKKWVTGKRIQSIQVKHPWIEDVKIIGERTKDKERRLRRKKINEIKEALEKMPYREIMIIDQMIKKMVTRDISIVKDERRN